MTADAGALSLQQGPATPPRFGWQGWIRVFRPLALDFLTTLLFAGLYAATHNLWLATAAGVVAGIAQIAWRLLRREPVAAMQWAGLGLVLVMGSAALVVGDARIVMLKPTVIYLVIGAAMLQPGWMLRYSPTRGPSPIPRGTFVAAGYAISTLMVVSAALNAWVALAMGATAWAAFIAVWPMSTKVAGFGLTALYFRRVARRNVRAGRYFDHQPSAKA